MPAPRQDHGALPRRRMLQRSVAIAGGLLAAGTVSAREAEPALADPVRHRRWKRPRSRLADAVDDLLTSTSPRFLVDHCHRSFALGLLIAEAGDIELDVEVLFAGVLLHDLGLTTRFHSPTVRFEVASANAARDLVRAHGMSRARADNVWDVCALHATGGISDEKSPETNVGSNGIGADVTGLGLNGFPPEVISQIMATRPGFAEPFIDAIVADLQDKPEVASSTWMSTIAADHIPGFHQGSIEQLALDDPFEHA